MSLAMSMPPAFLATSTYDNLTAALISCPQLQGVAFFKNDSKFAFMEDLTDRQFRSRDLGTAMDGQLGVIPYRSFMKSYENNLKKRASMIEMGMVPDWPEGQKFSTKLT